MGEVGNCDCLLDSCESVPPYFDTLDVLGRRVFLALASIKH